LRQHFGENATRSERCTTALMGWGALSQCLKQYCRSYLTLLAVVTLVVHHAIVQKELLFRRMLGWELLFDVRSIVSGMVARRPHKCNEVHLGVLDSHADLGRSAGNDRNLPDSLHSDCARRARLPAPTASLADGVGRSLWITVTLTHGAVFGSQ
jgi:hypothetical protein